MFDFVAFALVSSVPRRMIGWEERPVLCRVESVTFNLHKLVKTVCRSVFIILHVLKTAFWLHF